MSFALKNAMKDPIVSFYKNRKMQIQKEKQTICPIVASSWIMTLLAITFFLYLFANKFLMPLPNSEPYIYVSISSATGAIWGLGISEAAKFWNWSKYGNRYSNNFDVSRKGEESDWYSIDSFPINLQTWKNRFFISTFIAIILGVIIFP